MAGLDIPRCQLVYVNRDNGLLKKFDVHFDDEVWAKVVGTIATVEASVKKGTPPEREISRWVCRTCKFKHVCEPDY